MDGLDGMKNAFSFKSPFINYLRILEIEFRRVDSEVSEVHLIFSAIHKLFTEHNFLSSGHGQFMARIIASLIIVEGN